MSPESWASKTDSGPASKLHLFQFFRPAFIQCAYQSYELSTKCFNVNTINTFTYQSVFQVYFRRLLIKSANLISLRTFFLQSFFDSIVLQHIPLTFFSNVTNTNYNTRRRILRNSVFLSFPQGISLFERQHHAGGVLRTAAHDLRVVWQR